MIRFGELASVLGAEIITSHGDLLSSSRSNCKAGVSGGDYETLDLHDLEHDSRHVRPGSIFACVTGDRSDGHDYACAAVEAGARALLVERPLSGRVQVPQLLVDSVRRVLGMSAAAVHGYPSKRVDLDRCHRH